jgi:hypothetical protein
LHNNTYDITDFASFSLKHLMHRITLILAHYPLDHVHAELK